MKRCHTPLFVVASYFAISSLLFAQSDSVDVTFYYKPAGNPSVVFLPGEFNNWGPNSNGTIASNAPSRMSYEAARGQWLKTVRLRVGGPASGGGVTGAYQYKFNENGTGGGWLSDPLNPRRNSNDNNNSVLYVRNPVIHYLLPNSGSGQVSGTLPNISAYIFPARNSAIDTAALRLFINATEYKNLGANYDAATKFFSFIPPAPLPAGSHKVKLVARSTTGSQNADSTTFNILINPPLAVEELPAGVKDGINYINPTTATLVLQAPRKAFVYLIGSFNNWQIDTNYFMKRTPDSSRYWITLDNLAPANQYLFQYLVDGSLRIADPYAEQVSDPFNDQFISSTTYPNLIRYPAGQTEEIASVLQTDQTPYNWQATNYQRPAQKDVVIYELLIRDFIAAHDYKTMIDTLNYLQKLGVNAIELMPINEFAGNSSWGYNPSFYFAADKYYGPRQDLKRFVDECHRRGMAVILDMVLQHSDGQHPLVRLYNAGGYGPPAPGNPWYNVSAPHTDFSFGYDFNHESNATKAFVDQVNSYWLQEYRIDGFRFDFTRGFTNRFGPSGARDNARIAILKRMADQIWAVDSTAYVILEHLIDDNSEMKELAEYRRGMMLWGNLNTAYSQSAMGWLEDSGLRSDLSGGYYKTRGWNKPGLITYMESHDEEWLMYKNLQFGRSSGNYNVKDLNTALSRIKLVAAFFLTVPGPKMLWQFGEQGYDQHLPSGNEPGRTDPKPIRWNYFQQPERLKLYKVFAALLKLRHENEVFRSADTQVDWRVGQGQYDRRINLTHPSINVTIVGNFHVMPLNVNPNFQGTGTWYDYFSGDSISVASTQAALPLQPGEFHVYTTKRLPPPESGLVTGVEEPFDREVVREFGLEQNYPNPFNPSTTIRYALPKAASIAIRIYDTMGREVKLIFAGMQAAGMHALSWNGTDGTGREVHSGVYFVRLETAQQISTWKIMLLR
ncbi:MAG: alpha-amylase family glycosyl hydrolase [bacterium]